LCGGGQALLAQLGGQTLAVALQNEPQQTQEIWMSLFGVGVQVGAMLPFPEAMTYYKK
jgi:hypothetical protein